MEKIPTINSQGVETNINQERINECENVINWKKTKEKIIDGNLLEIKNFHDELERISKGNVPELSNLASKMKLADISKKNDIIVSNLKLGGYGWCSRGLLKIKNKESGLISYKILGQSFVAPIEEKDEFAIVDQDDLDEHIMHESIHYYTSAVLDLYQQNKDKRESLKKCFTEQAIDFAGTIDNLYETYKEKDGHFNISEFVSYGLTSTRPTLGSPMEANKLKKIKLPNQESLYAALFTAFVKYYNNINPDLFLNVSDKNGNLNSDIINLTKENHLGNRTIEDDDKIS